MQVQLGSRLVGDGCPTFIVAEIGQNHQGDVYTALRLAGEAVKAGADAVKFQLRDAAAEFPHDVLDAPHSNSEHAFGPTYREHRAALDLSADQLAHIKREYNRWPVEFFATPCAVSCVAPLEDMGVEFYKIASKDRFDEHLWDAVRSTGKPIISSSLGYWVKNIPDVLQYCVPMYPTPLSEISLRSVLAWHKNGRHPIIGYSDHSGTPTMGIAAAALGAATIEVHLTFSKQMKGTDHRASLEVPEFAQMVKAIREIDATRGHQIRDRRDGAVGYTADCQRNLVGVPAGRDD